MHKLFYTSLFISEKESKIKIKPPFTNRSSLLCEVASSCRRKHCTINLFILAKQIDKTYDFKFGDLALYFFQNF